MGLDVYLYRCRNWDANERINRETRGLDEREYAALKERFPEDFSNQSQEVRDIFSKQWRDQEERRSEALGKENALATGVDKPSELYPDEHFRIGYFRSSYNDSGINSVANSLGLPGLYDIFEGDYDGGEYMAVDWEVSRTVANDAVERWSEFINSDRAKFAVVECRDFGVNQDKPLPKGKKEVMDKFFEEKVANKGSYSNYYGNFFLDSPAKVVACIRGEPTFSFGENIRSHFLVVERDKGQYDYYMRSMEIVLETIENVPSACFLAG